MKKLVCLALCVGTVCMPRVSSAYTIASGFTQSCHERMSIPALTYYLERLEGVQEIPLPADDLWKGATGDIEALVAAHGELAGLLEDESLRFAAVSILVGLREPDTGGYSIADLSAIRSVHGDPAPRAQYAHALRSSGDTGSSGDWRAIVGTRDYVGDQLGVAGVLLSTPPAAQLTTTHLYVEHYGRIEVEVWGPAYRLGLALHALQDSFSHSIRSNDHAYILHVLNYVDAVEGELDETHGGLAHSTGMDECDASANAALVEEARNRSTAMVVALLKFGRGDDGQAVAEGLSDCGEGDVGRAECGWFSYYPECQERVEAGQALEGTCCSRETDFCNAQQLPLILATPTRPILQRAFGCSFKAERTAFGAGFLWLILALLLVRARRRSRYGLAGLAFVGVGLVGLPRAEAQEHFVATPVVRIEGHASLLTDAANESLLNISYGPALRAGYRLRGTSQGQWGFFGVVERDSWVVSDIESRVDPGVFNAALGVEFLYFGYFRSALALGPSILVFDTGLHDAGNTGIFVDLHPVGVQFNWRHRWAFTFDPLSVSWVNPSPEWGHGPSVGHLQYRTTLGLEWRAVPNTRCRPLRSRCH